MPHSQLESGLVSSLAQSSSCCLFPGKPQRPEKNPKSPLLSIPSRRSHVEDTLAVLWARCWRSSGSQTPGPTCPELVALAPAPGLLLLPLLWPGPKPSSQPCGPVLQRGLHKMPEPLSNLQPCPCCSLCPSYQHHPPSHIPSFPNLPQASPSSCSPNSTRKPTHTTQSI